MTKDMNIRFGSAITVRALSLFYRRFASIVRAGVSLNDALGMLSEQTDNKRFAEAIENLQVNIQEDETLANSMRQYPEYFSEMMVSLVEAGETSGSLDMSLERIHIQLEKDAKLQGKIKNAMKYPLMLCGVVIAVIFAMAVFVIPGFVAMFADLDIEIPALMLGVISVGNFIKKYWFVLLTVVVILVFAIMWFQKTDLGQYFFSGIGLKIPVFYNFIVKSSVYRMVQMLITLLHMGTPMSDALEITANTMTNLHIKYTLIECKEELMKGVPFSETLDHWGIFPPMLVHMVKLGEETGDMKAMLVKMADYYDKETESAVRSLITFLGLVINLLLAVGILILVIVIVMPMISLYTGLGSL